MEAVVTERRLSPEIKSFFSGGDLPTDVYVYPGTGYYKRLEDIRPQIKPERGFGSSIERYEDRFGVALQVCPPLEGEPDDASFRLVGERGMYVRVIVGEVEEKIGEQVVRRPDIRWIHYNPEGVKTPVYT